MQKLSAYVGSCREFVCHAGDDRMRKSPIGHAASDVGNMVGELTCEIIHALNHRVGIDAQLFGQPTPVIKPDISQAVFTAELHGKLDALDVDFRVGKDARHVIQGCETGTAFGTDEQCIILGMGVRARNQPVIGDRVEETRTSSAALVE
jgi:hypothetical protein